MRGAEKVIAFENVSVRFVDSAGTTIDALKSVSLQFEPGVFHAVIGPSGSGKTTLLHVVAGILKATSGTVRTNDHNLSEMRERARDAWRRNHCGLIFQDFRLIDELSPLANTMVPGWFGRTPPGVDVRRKAEQLLAHFDVPQRAGPVSMLSRGQQQRVAMARALVLSPEMILADEPTASVDKTNALLIIDELARLAHEGKTVIAVSHDDRVAQRADRVLGIRDGVLFEDPHATDAETVEEARS
jgi:putative ABC transport system ATP-binding protein